MRRCYFLMICDVPIISSCRGSSVPALPEARGQQAADHAAEAQEVQEPDHPGLQDAGSGLAGHGPGAVR